MVCSLGCVWSFATRANLGSDLTAFPASATVDTLGKGSTGRRFPVGLQPPSARRPTLVCYTTSRDANAGFRAVLLSPAFPQCDLRKFRHGSPLEPRQCFGLPDCMHESIALLAASSCRRTRQKRGALLQVVS